MFPIGDTDVEDAGPGLVTIALVLVNAAVFVFEVTAVRSGLPEFFNQFGVVPARVLEGEQLYTFLTSLFVHGGWFHLISNMVFLWIFGDNVEAALGRLLYPVFYVVGGVVASLTHVFVSPASTLPSVGASGAIGAVLGAYVVMFPKSRVRVLLLLGYFLVVRRVTAVLFLGLWFVMQFFSGVASLGAETAQTGGVAVWAHVGGFAFGLLVGFLLRERAKDLTLEREPPRQGRRPL